MSSVVIAGDTSGSITLQAPSIANTSTLTLPATTATLLTDSSGVLNIGSGQLYKDASGNVGIGTSAPTVPLSVSYSNTTIPTLGGGSVVGVFNTSTSSSAVSSFVFNGVDAGATSRHSGAIVWSKTGAWTAGGANYSASLAFWTRPDGGDEAERMRIDSSGNVGIGKTNPQAKLHVQGTPTNSSVLVSNVTSGLNIGMIGNYASWQGSGTNDDFVVAGYGARDLVLGTNGTLRVLINASGNVGIGTTAVSYGTGLPHKQSLWFDPAVNNDGLFIACTAASGTAALFYTNTSGSPNAAGSITVLNATTSYNVSSDQRLKYNIKPSGSATQSILDFPIDSFDWNDSGMHVSFGGVAQKILPIVPEMVHVPDDPDAMMGIDWSKAVPRLIKTIQELKAIIDTQQEQINFLLGK